MRVNETKSGPCKNVFGTAEQTLSSPVDAPFKECETVTRESRVDVLGATAKHR